MDSETPEQRRAYRRMIIADERADAYAQALREAGCKPTDHQVTRLRRLNDIADQRARCYAES